MITLGHMGEGQMGPKTDCAILEQPLIHLHIFVFLVCTSFEFPSITSFICNFDNYPSLPQH